MTEMLQSQIEVATPPCTTTEEARGHLAHYRRTLAKAAAEHKLGLAAMGTFPLAFWPEQIVTPKARYGADHGRPADDRLPQHAVRHARARRRCRTSTPAST